MLLPHRSSPRLSKVAVRLQKSMKDERKAESNVSLVNIHRIAEALGVPAGDLFASARAAEWLQGSRGGAERRGGAEEGRWLVLRLSFAALRRRLRRRSGQALLDPSFFLTRRRKDAKKVDPGSSPG